mmetsp:Transcript_498/g.1096  ORF Transcript_498/g.1096 Transcript_498/m.1096 type:complete len:218 (-) Transcript_498:48-701(-)
MLGETTELEVPVGPNVSQGRVQLASHELDEGRLAGTVGPDQCHPRIQIDAKIDVLVERLAPGVSKGNVVKGQDGRGEVSRIGKLEIEHLFFLGFFGETRPDHFLEDLFLGLCLLGVLGGSVAEAGDVFFHLLDGILFPLVLFPLVLFLFGLGLDELVVVPVVVFEGPRIGKVYHVAAHVVEEILGVADQEQDAGPLGKIVLEPDDGLHVQVVRRFVQ